MEKEGARHRRRHRGGLCVCECLHLAHVFPTLLLPVCCLYVCLLYFFPRCFSLMEIARGAPYLPALPQVCCAVCLAAILLVCVHTHTPALLHSFTPSLLYSFTPLLPHSFTPSHTHTCTRALLLASPGALALLRSVRSCGLHRRGFNQNVRLASYTCT